MGGKVGLFFVIEGVTHVFDGSSLLINGKVYNL